MNVLNHQQILFTESNQISNYYHIMVDFLPIIYKEYLLNPNISIDFDYPLRTDLIKKIIEIMFDSTVNIKEHLTTPKIYPYNTIKNSIDQHYLKYIRNIAKSKTQTIKSHDKILIYRNNRYICDELIQYLKNIGFVEIDCENLTIVEQLCVFSNAKIIIGSHGAGLTNILYCNQDALIIELNNGFNMHCYPNIAKLCGLTIHTLFDENIFVDIKVGDRRSENRVLGFGDIQWELPNIKNHHIVKNNIFNMDPCLFKTYINYIINDYKHRLH